MNKDPGILITRVARFLPLLFTLLFFVSPSLQAAECSAVFPSGAANSTNAGSVTIQWGANILNSPGNDIVTRNLYQYALWGCGFLSVCDETNSISAPATDFNNFPTAANISVAYQATRNMTPGNYGSITTDSRVTLNFAPGDYTVRGNLNLGSETIVNVSTTGTVRLFVQGNVTFGAQTNTNLGGTNRYLYVYTRGSFSLVSSAQARAVIYAKGNADLGNNTTLTGALTSEASVSIQNGATLNYSSSIIASADFGGSCGVVAPVITTFVVDTGGSSASTCSAKNITITARDGSNNILTGYTGTISITTSTGRGTWAKTNVAANANGTLVFGNDNGQATYTFTAADAGDIVLALSNQRAQSLTITVVDSSISATSSTVTFGDNAFVIASANASWGEDVVGMRDHPFTATMIRRDSNTGACGVATGYNVPNLRMWLTRHVDDPVNSAAPSAVSPGVVSLPNTQPASNNVTLSFTNGVATFSLRTTDVGKYAINLADTSNSFSSSTVSGSSNTLVVRPFAIRIQVSGNIAATSASGPAFRKAGQTFTVTVTAVGWQTADDGNSDGVADGHDDLDPANNANLSDNLPLVRFATPIALGSKLIQPQEGFEAGLSGGAYSTFSAGSASASNISYGEVGIIELTAALSPIGTAYLGSPGSSKIIGRSGYVGRFYPDHFRLSNTASQPSCNSVLPYTYLDEPFSLNAIVTPYNAAGIAVQNYQGGFRKLNTAGFVSMLSAVDGAVPLSLTNRITVTSDTYNWTPAWVLTATPKIKINRSATPDGPFAQVRIGFAPTDTDAVGLRASDLNLDTNGDGIADAARLGATTMGLRFGRLRLDDSYGPETANLPVIFRTEYWDGSEWKQNRDDSCTQIALTRIRYPGGPINVVANRSPAVGAGSTTGTYANLNATAVAFTSGDAGHYFTAPGAGNTGSVRVQVDLTDYPWLRFDWNSDGNFSDTSLPDAYFTFGNYRGHDRMLYWIEAAGY